MEVFPDTILKFLYISSLKIIYDIEFIFRKLCFKSHSLIHFYIHKMYMYLYQKWRNTILILKCYTRNLFCSNVQSHILPKKCDFIHIFCHQYSLLLEKALLIWCMLTFHTTIIWHTISMAISWATHTSYLGEKQYQLDHVWNSCSSFSLFDSYV